MGNLALIWYQKERGKKEEHAFASWAAEFFSFPVGNFRMRRREKFKDIKVKEPN